MSAQVSRGHKGEMLIRIEGVFDTAAAARLRGLLLEAGTDCQVVVDFSRASEIHDFGLAAVAGGIAGQDRVQLSGLGLHHSRLLRYCGLGTGSPASQS